MRKNGKKLSNPFSTGGGGGQFEAHVQASFVVLMLTGGFAPCIPCWPISKIKLQGKFAGFDTDDMIVFVEKASSDQKRKILAQIKHSISITENEVFGEVIQRKIHLILKSLVNLPMRSLVLGFPRSGGFCNSQKDRCL